jgi:hypothetical protein
MLYQQRSCKEELALIFESYSVNCKRNKLEHQEAEPKDARVRIPTTLPDDQSTQKGNKILSSGTHLTRPYRSQDTSGWFDVML